MRTSPGFGLIFELPLVVVSPAHCVFVLFSHDHLPTFPDLT